MTAQREGAASAVHHPTERMTHNQKGKRELEYLKRCKGLVTNKQASQIQLR